MTDSMCMCLVSMCEFCNFDSLPGRFEQWNQSIGVLFLMRE